MITTSTIEAGSRRDLGAATAAGGPEERRVLRWDPCLEPGDSDMRFRLTYSGILPSHGDDGSGRKARAPHKHAMRKAFRRQLVTLWDIDPNLKPWNEPRGGGEPPAVEKIANNLGRNGFRFVPLITKSNGLVRKLGILMPRPSAPGGTADRSDIDNRLKTLFDALRTVDNAGELGGHTPVPGEDPSYVLLQDERLVTRASVETDLLLEPVCGDDNYTRVLITVTTRSHHPASSPMGLPSG